MLVTSVAGYSHPALPQSVARELQPASDFLEHYRPGALISGSPLVGASPSDQGRLGTKLEVSLPDGLGGKEICIQATTIDGRYEASREYLVPEGWSAGVASIPFPTNYRSQLELYASGQLAVMASLGRCSEARDDLTIVPVWWAGAPAPSGHVILYVNSLRADETVAFLSDGSQVECDPVVGNVRTAFDTLCRIALSDNETAGALSVEVSRVRDGEFLPSAFVEILTGSR